MYELLNHLSIINELSRNGFEVSDIKHTNTHLVRQIAFYIETKEDALEKGTICLWTSPKMKNRIHINTCDAHTFRTNTLERVDEIIKSTIFLHPKNRFPSLFNQSYVLSNLSNKPLYIFEDSFFNIQSELTSLLSSTKPIDSDEVCFYSLNIPKSNFDDQFIDILLSSEATYNIEENGNLFNASFHRFNPSLVLEREFILSIRTIFEENGIPADISVIC